MTDLEGLELMIVVNELRVPDDKKSAVTIGKFDGIHIGHRLLIDNITGMKDKGYNAVCVAFEMGGNHIYTDEESAGIMKECDVDVLIRYRFDDKMKCMSPEQFVKDILIDKLNAGYVCVGDDFRFGYNRQGNSELLVELGKHYGIRVDIVVKKWYEGDIVSSTRIRKLLDEGNIRLISELLGRPYTFKGKVIHGNQLGRTIGFPTINIAADEGKYMPANGVYASYVLYKGMKYRAVTNIGVKPTIDGNNQLGIETYIFDFDRQIYGEEVTVGLVKFIRNEMKFSGLDELKKQIEIDKNIAKEIS